MEPIVLEGTLRIWDQEGVYAAPDILIDDVSIPVILEEFFDYLRKKAAEGIYPDGRYRFTLEQIE